MSDIYAMGGKPLFALNIAAFPEDLDPSILADILTGAEETASEAGIPILGGHTITGPFLISIGGVLGLFKKH